MQGQVLLQLKGHLPFLKSNSNIFTCIYQIYPRYQVRKWLQISLFFPDLWLNIGSHVEFLLNKHILIRSLELKRITFFIFYFDWRINLTTDRQFGALVLFQK